MGEDAEKQETRGVVIAGLAGGSGKSVVAIGLTAFLVRRGVRAVPFKKGPDYIDAGWLSLAAGRDCYNLDPYLMSEEAIRRSFYTHCREGEVAVVEGNRGLFDGVDARGAYSTAELAVMLGLPIVLVVNCWKVTRTVAAMVLGCRELDPRIDIRGVILNNVATERQQKIITQSVEEYSGVPVVGVVPRMTTDIFPMRHLGVTPHQEYQDCDEAIDYLTRVFSSCIDQDRLDACMTGLPVVKAMSHPVLDRPVGEKVRIGVIRDAAFQFYYPGNLEALQEEGAQLVPLNAMQDADLPELDGLYIGGGFPETNAAMLAENSAFRQSVYQAAEKGLPVYAECGGLIYLGESIEMGGEVYQMAGVLPARFGMSERPQAHGYSIFQVEKDTPFYQRGQEVKGHEFRYSTVLEWRGTSEQLTVRMKRGKGFINGWDGVTYNNVFALYTHVHAYGTPQWAPAFVQRCRQFRQERAETLAGK